MDTFENENPGVEQQEPAPQTSQPYSGVGVGRKESPFADSPYVMNHETSGSGSAYVPPVPPRKPKKQKKSGKVWKKALSVVMALLVVAGSCGVTAALVNRHWENQTQQMTQDFNARLNSLQQQIDANSQTLKDNSNTVTVIEGSAVMGRMDAGQVYANNVQSVVLITCRVTTTLYGQTTTGTSAGSGFILTEDGYVVTNHHVIDGASSVTVTTYDGEEFAAKVVGSDSNNDVAVLKMEGTDFPCVTIGSSDALSVGDQVVAIGNPLGELTSTLTVGYISAKERDVTTDGTTINMLQTDAAINSGNSGGPLFNMKGEVVGITTAKYSGNSSSGASIEGIGFAIPIDDVIGMVDDLMKYGYVTGAYLGVMVSNMDSATASYYGLPMGAYVQEVTAGYCAEAAGVKAKDIIVALGDYEVENITDLTRALRNFKAGDTTTITVVRSGVRMVLTVTLDEKPAATTTTTTPETPDASQMPQDGSFEEWYNYFAPYFGDNG